MLGLRKEPPRGGIDVFARYGMLKERMATLNVKQLILFFGIFGAMAVLLIAGANFLLWNIAPPPFPDTVIRDDALLPKNQAEKFLSKPVASNTQPMPNVAYENGAFYPERVFLGGQKENVGCLVVLQNRSQEILRIGMNPHNPSGNDRGLDFKDIAPGENLIFDPRFVGISELSLHNHRVPSEGFIAILEKDCQM